MKIKVNGKWVEVKEGDEVETAEGGAEDTDLDEEEEDEEVGSSEKSIMKKARKIGEEIGQKIAKELSMDGTKEVSMRMEKFLNDHYGMDSKLTKILNGKDLFGDKSELTKEEKIVGFFYALVNNNTPALKALSEGTAADGGYLFPNEFMAEVIRDLPNINPMRNEVRVIPMSRNKMDISGLSEHPKVYWTAENASKTTTTARFEQKQLVAYKAAAIIYSSDELIEDSTETDVVALILQLFTEAIADEEDRVIWLGNGTTQPQGIAVATLTTQTVNGTGNMYNDLTNIFYALPAKYRNNAAWYMNSQTAAAIESQKDSQNRPLFTVGTDTMPPTIKGKRVVIDENIPPRQVYIADMKRAYFLGDRKRMSAKVSNDTETAFTKDQTAIRVVFRIAGLVVLPQAIRKGTNF